ncbi:hypothetical protein [Shewanella sp. GXUN23E]|uniref:hypothetical protein n=1 Tax=Shewanella sp. GXUN23E TaxID=3422498 RepID=UPI003D7E9992
MMTDSHDDNSDALRRAQEILSQPLTLELIREFDALTDNASGDVANQLYDLWEALYVKASIDPVLVEAATAEGLL